MYEIKNLALSIVFCGSTRKSYQPWLPLDMEKSNGICGVEQLDWLVQNDYMADLSFIERSCI